MPENDITALLVEEDVVIAQLVPSQGIRTELDTVYLYNPDAVSVKHDETLKGNGTSGNLLGISDEVMAKIEHGSSTFIFDFDASSTFWVIYHNLNKRPTVTVVDSTNAVVESTVEYLGNNAVQITLNSPFKGQAYLN